MSKSQKAIIEKIHLALDEIREYIVYIKYSIDVESKIPPAVK